MHLESVVTVKDSNFTGNFAKYGGIGYVNNEGSMNLDTIRAVGNSAFLGNAFFVLNTQKESFINKLSC